jgi:hypothetical protein
MAIARDPSKLETTLTLHDDARVRVRSIRPADAGLDRAFFEGLSKESRYQRFMHASICRRDRIRHPRRPRRSETLDRHARSCARLIRDNESTFVGAIQ